MGTHILTMKDVPTIEVSTLGDRAGEPVEGCDGFTEVHLERKFQIVQALKNRGWFTSVLGDGMKHAPVVTSATPVPPPRRRQFRRRCWSTHQLQWHRFWYPPHLHRQ